MTDPDNQDLHDALDLYSQRIPETEQFSSPDIIRWLREDLERIDRGTLRPRDFFLIAKSEEQVCGFLLLHFYPQVNYAFIAYLVASKDPPMTNFSRDGVSRALLAKVRELMAPGEDLEACQGLLLEVDRPASADTAAESKHRLARIKLFCTLAEAQGFSLRAFDMGYLQPPLSLSEPDSTVPMLLMYARPKAGQPANFMRTAEVRQVLKFIYMDLYPEGYSDNEIENREYKAHLRRFCSARTKALPRRIPMLDFKQLQSSLHGARYVIEKESLSAADTNVVKKAVDAPEIVTSKQLEEPRTGGGSSEVKTQGEDDAKTGSKLSWEQPVPRLLLALAGAIAVWTLDRIEAPLWLALTTLVVLLVSAIIWSPWIQTKRRRLCFWIFLAVYAAGVVSVVTISQWQRDSQQAPANSGKSPNETPRSDPSSSPHQQVPVGSP